MIDSQTKKLENVNTSPLFFEDIEVKFQSFHGRMVNVLSPLEENWICDVLTRIATLFVSIVVYPAWGAIKVLEAGMNAINACFIKNEKSSKAEVQSNAEVQTEELQQFIAIKKRIASDFTLWSQMVNVDNFQGEKISIFFAYNINGSRGNPGAMEIKTSEGFKEFIKVASEITQPLIELIDPRYSEININIEILIIGELRKMEDSELVDYQSFTQTHTSTSSIGHTGFQDEELKDSFMENYVKNFKVLEIPAQLWNEDGSLIY